MQVSMEGVKTPQEFVKKLIDHFQAQGITKQVPGAPGLSIGKTLIGNTLFGNA
jgi:hypothetical protein